MVYENTYIHTEEVTKRRGERVKTIVATDKSREDFLLKIEVIPGKEEESSSNEKRMR